MDLPRDHDDEGFSDPAPFERDALPEENGVELEPDQLSAEALRGLVEEFVSREGTDYGHADRSLESKVADVRRQLDSGEARIVFDLATETVSIVSRPERGATR